MNYKTSIVNMGFIASALVSMLVSSTAQAVAPTPSPGKYFVGLLNNSSNGRSINFVYNDNGRTVWQCIDVATEQYLPTTFQISKGKSIFYQVYADKKCKGKVLKKATTAPSGGYRYWLLTFYNKS